MDHLACYLPGNLALGVGEGAVRGAKAQLYASVAANLTYTCWQMYERMATGQPSTVLIELLCSITLRSHMLSPYSSNPVQSELALMFLSVWTQQRESLATL